MTPEYSLWVCKSTMKVLSGLTAVLGSNAPGHSLTLCQAQQVHRKCHLLMAFQEQSDFVFGSHSVFCPGLESQKTDQNRISGHGAGTVGT